MRLAKLESDYDGKVEIEWRSFLLRPEPRPRSRDSFIEYTKRWVAPGGPADLAPECEFRVWTIDDPEPPTHSIPTAIAGKIARGFGKAEFDRFHLAAMRAYFVEHRTISDPEVLADIAQQCRIPRDEFASRLRRDGAEIRAQVVAEHHAGTDADVHAVPSVVVRGPLADFAVPGAQDLDVYRRMIDRLLARLDED